MTHMSHFAQPLWLVAGFGAVPVLLLVYWLIDRVKRQRIRVFSLVRDTDSALFGVSQPLLWVKRSVFCLAVLATCVGLARPLGALQMQETEQRGFDILFAVDTSRSMLTPDVKPNRLTRAKLAVEDLLDHLNGDGVGLLAFAGEADLQAPVTTDYDAFRESLEAVDTNTVPLGGTDIASAIHLAESTLALRGDAQKVLVLITDGEDLGGDALYAAQQAAKQGLIIFTVGVGTAAGELIPVPDDAGGTQYVKDSTGNFVKSHLDADMLQQIAAATGGVYMPLGPQNQGVLDLYDEKLKAFAQRQHADHQVAVYAELFQWPLGVAIGLLILEWLLGVSVRRRDPTPSTSAVPLAALALGVAMAVAPRVWSSPRTAQQEYASGQYSQAQRDYAKSLQVDPGQAPLQFNLGAAAYKAGDFSTAAAAFNKALETRNVPLQQSAYYNLGNALYRQGERGVATDPQTTIKTWQQSIDAYDTALQLRSADADARFNRGVVQGRLDALQRQQQQKQQQQKQNQGGKNDHKDQQNQQGQQGQQGQQNQPNQQNQANQQKQQNQQQSQQQQQQQQQNQQQHQNQQNQQPGQNAGQSPQNAAAAAQDIGKPDQMSRVEAEQLLDSAKGEERHLAIGLKNGKPASPPAVPLKDW